LKKPIALITGAGTGLGKELALLLSKTHHVILVGRRQLQLDELATKINQDGDATAISCDITNTAQILSLELQLQDLSLLPVDLVINNAGIGHFGSIESMEIEEWDQMFQTNTLAPMTITKIFLPYMKRQKSGVFINILSTAALRGKINESGYVASKYALRGFSESMAKELEPFGVRVVRAYMGGMNTPFWNETNHINDPSQFRTPKEVAQTILTQMNTQDEIKIESK